MGYDEEDLLLRGGFRGGGEMDGLLDPPPQSTRVRSSSRYGSRSMGGGMRLRSNSSGPPDNASTGAPKSTSASGPPPGGGGKANSGGSPPDSSSASGPPNQSNAPPSSVSSNSNPGKSQVPPPILRSSSSKGILNDNLGPALTRLGRSIGLSVEIFAAVGETIADENPEIRGDMLEACRESRAVGNSLEKLCEGLCLCVNNTRNGSSSSASTSMLPGNLSGGGLLHSLSPSDFETLIRSARVLLSGVTRILLLADNVVVNKLLISNDGGDDPPKAVVQSAGGGGSSLICDQLSSLKTMHHFTEFVKAFCDYGSEMVHFLRLIGDEDRRDKEDRRRCQIDCARLILDRSATLLLTATQSFLHHPDQSSARENRDTVFCQMRRALDLIHYIIKEGVVESSNKFCLGHPIDQSPVMTETCISEELNNSTVLRAIKYFEDSVEIMRMSIVSDSYKEQITSNLESIIERTQDFTDSAYTSHEHRQNIIMLCERSTIELAHLLRTTMSNTSHHHHHHHGANNPVIDMNPVAPLEFDEALRNLLKTTKELGLELQQIALEHAGSLISNCRIGREILHNLKGAALSANSDRLAMQSERLTEYMDYVEDVAKLVRHVTRTESAQIRAKHAQINLHIYGSQVPVAASTLCHDPHSKVAKDNLETFCTMWQYLVDDVIQISKHVADTTINGAHSRGSTSSNSGSPFIQQHKSVPNLGMGMTSLGGGGGGPFLGLPKEDMESRRHSSPGLVQHPPSQQQQQQQSPYSSNPMHHGPQQSNQQQQQQSSYYPSAYRTPEEFLNSFKDVEKNEIINRAKKMAAIAKCMFNFTRGEGKVKTTQDLFTQAEYFAEESNLLYKVIRIFSYDVPTGEDKRVLMAIADNVPKHCHQMQMLIQSTTVGKAATFTKVDSIIKETRTIMQLVVRIVEVCYSNATKYSLDFSNVSSEGRTHSSDDTSQTFGSSGASGSGTNSASDSS